MRINRNKSREFFFSLGEQSKGKCQKKINNKISELILIVIDCFSNELSIRI